MNILLATPYGGVPGGISRWTEHIIKYYNSLPTKDVKLDLLPMGRSSFVSKYSSVFFRLKSGYLDYCKILRDFRKKLKYGKYDVMHLVSSASISLCKDLYMLRKAHRHKIKTVIHFRFGRIPSLSVSKNWEWRLLCKVVKLADKVIVIDKLSYDVLKKEGYNNIELLPNPVAPSISDIIEKNKDIVRVPRSILFAGHVIKTKGIFELVEACKQIPNIQLRLVGHVLPEMKEELENKVGYASWLHVEGEKPYEEVIKEMLACDLFVLPTYTEGFPNVILESMACGCAIIATKVGAIPEMLEEKDSKVFGYLIDPKNVQQIKEGICFLLDNECLKNGMRTNAKQRVNERYGIDVVWEKMKMVWCKMILNN